MIIRDPTASADDFVAMAARLGLHGTDYVVGWTAWLDLSPVGVSKASGLRVRRPPARPRPDRTRSRSATAATTSRCCAGPAAGWRWARPSQEVHDAADATTETVYDDGAAVELRRWFRDGPGGPPQPKGPMSLPETVATERLDLRLVTPEDAEGMLAGPAPGLLAPRLPAPATTRTRPRW